MPHISCHQHTPAIPSHAPAPRRALSHLLELWECWRHFPSAVLFSLKYQVWALLHSLLLPPVLLLPLLGKDGLERAARWEKTTLLQGFFGHGSLPSDAHEGSNTWHTQLCLCCWILRQQKAQTWFMLGVHAASSKMSVVCGLGCQGSWKEPGLSSLLNTGKPQIAGWQREGSQHTWPVQAL